MQLVYQPLAQFFTILVASARKAGFKCIATILAREADASEIFDELSKYWTSLDDVTGSSILFVLGGPFDNSTRHGKSIIRAGNGVGYTNAFVRYLGGCHDLYCSQADVGRPENMGCTSMNIVADSHSLQISGLRDMLRMSECDIPSVLLFHLSPFVKNAEIRPAAIIPIGDLPKSSVYQLMKELYQRLQAISCRIDSLRATELVLKRTRRKMHPRVTSASLMQMSEFYLSSEGPGIRAARAIIGRCQDQEVIQGNRRKCNSELQCVREELGKHHSLARNLQSLIDFTYFSLSKDYVTSKSRNAVIAERIELIRSERISLWTELQDEIRGLGSRDSSAYMQEGLSSSLAAIERSLRMSFRQSAPASEKLVQDQIEIILASAGLAYTREKETAPVGPRAFKPDFVLGEYSLAIEVKLARPGHTESKIQEEISADISAYGTRWKNMLFVIYDIGVILDPVGLREENKRLFGVHVLIVKH